jgi:hypothetical protein
MQELVIWWIYKHFKGHEIEILNVAQHTETMEYLVIYKHLHDPSGEMEGHIRARPTNMFFDTVERNWEKMPRFQYIGK